MQIAVTILSLCR